MTKQSNLKRKNVGASIVARREIMCRLIPTFSLLAAAIESGISYFIHSKDFLKKTSHTSF